MGATSDDVFLRSGPITAVLHGAELRDIRVAGHVAFDGVYSAVRDEQWGTVAAEVSDVRVAQSAGRFLVTFGCAHPAFGFRWCGRYEAGDGRLQIHLDGCAERDIAVNRVGFCLLHPIELAGVEADARTAAGPNRMRFPEHIAPGALLSDVVGLGYDVAPGVHVDVEFHGDQYEVEDHRNWTDAGWKTYSPPLNTPRPRVIRAGERIEQHIEIRATLGHDAVTARKSAPTLTVRDTVVGRLPQIGVLVDEHSDIATLATVQPSALSVHLRQDAGWRETLSAARRAATQLPVPLAITLIGSSEWMVRVAPDVAVAGPSRVGVSEPETAVPLPGMVTRTRAALRAAVATRRSAAHRRCSTPSSIGWSLPSSRGTLCLFPLRLRCTTPTTPGSWERCSRSHLSCPVPRGSAMVSRSSSSRSQSAPGGRRPCPQP